MPNLCLWALCWLGLFLPEAVAARVILRDDFNGAKGPANPALWQDEQFDQGSGRYVDRVMQTGKGQAVLAVTGQAGGDASRFGQQILRSNRLFVPAPGQVLTFRARLAMPHDQPGIVHAFFLYQRATDAKGTLRSDEIDFEWLTRQAQGGQDAPVLLSNWVGWNNDTPDFGQFLSDATHGTHQSVAPHSGAGLADYSVWSVDWSRKRIAWYREDASGRHLLAERHEPGAVPQRPMYLYLSSWVPDAGWDEAFEPGFHAGPAGNWPMLVDWVEVTSHKEMGAPDQ